MKNVLIFGAGKFGTEKYHRLIKECNVNVIAYIDNDSKKWNMLCNGKPVISPKEICNFKYDEILIAIERPYEAAEIVISELLELDIPKEKMINLTTDPNYMDIYLAQRFYWIRDYANWVIENNIRGNVAEAGVYRGDSARFINKYFSERKLYLFDTFTGFEADDVSYEKSLNNSSFNNSIFAKEKVFWDGNIDSVISKMPYPEKIVIKQGSFPESAEGVTDSFCFVSLDMDLFLPMLNGLRFFWSQMEMGGAILLHDYFHKELPGVKKAVSVFETEQGIKIMKTPIGDGCSIALIKTRMC